MTTRPHASHSIMTRVWKAVLTLYVLAVAAVSVSKAGYCDYAEPQEGQFLLCAGGNAIQTVVGHNTSLTVTTRPQYNLTEDLVLNVTSKDPSLIDIPEHVVISDSSNESVIPIAALRAGKTHIQFQYLHSNSAHVIVNLSLVIREVDIVHWEPLNIIITIIGWIYFVAWSVSFYPQIFLNFYRRSVVGLNFDFLAYNLTGFLCYGVFNIGLYWIPEVQREYLSQNPGGVIQVKLNDVVFTLHAVAVTAFTIFQCFIFERKGQRVSVIAILLLIIMWLFAIISLFVAVGGKLSWLLFLNFLSYIKLFVTIIKYVPQAWMNFRRKSTVGWSIGNVILDFTGGSFSILQMFLISYNYDDWKSIFGDPTKFGLGFFSICFDLLFMFQHYILYRNPPPDLAKDTEKEPLLAESEKEGKMKRLMTILGINY